MGDKLNILHSIIIDLFNFDISFSLIFYIFIASSTIYFIFPKLRKDVLFAVILSGIPMLLLAIGMLWIDFNPDNLMLQHITLIKSL